MLVDLRQNRRKNVPGNFLTHDGCNDLCFVQVKTYFWLDCWYDIFVKKRFNFFSIFKNSENFTKTQHSWSVKIRARAKIVV